MTASVPMPVLDPTRDLRELLFVARWPIFALSPGQTATTHHAGRERGSAITASVTLDAGATLGRATIEDGNVFALLVSAAVKARNEGRSLPACLDVRPNNLLRLLQRPPGGRQRRLLADGLERLKATLVVLHRGPQGVLPFTLLEGFERPAAGRHGPWRVRLPGFVRSEIEAGRVLKIAPSALQLHGLARRLYSICRVHAGGPQDQGPLDLGTVHRRAGSLDSFHRFCVRVARLAAAQAIPDFDLAVGLNAQGRPTLTITRRPTAEPQPRVPRLAPGADSQIVALEEFAEDDRHAGSRHERVPETITIQLPL